MCISSGEVGEGVRGVVGPKDIRNFGDVRGMYKLSLCNPCLCEQRPAVPYPPQVSCLRSPCASSILPLARKFRPNNTLGKFLRIFLQKRVHLPG